MSDRPKKWNGQGYEYLPLDPIKNSYADFDLQRRTEHIAIANNRFSTEEIEAAIRIRMVLIEEECRNRFGLRIQAIDAELEKLAKLAVLPSPGAISKPLSSRPDTTRLNELKQKRQDLKDSRDALIQQKRAAWEDFHDAKRRKEGWYRRADNPSWLLGNKGKQIPKHSILGQSKGDLAGYKSSMDRAMQAVKRLDDDIANVNREIERINAQLQDLGHRRTFSQPWQMPMPSAKASNADLPGIEKKFEALHQQRSALVSQQKHFQEQAKLDVGVAALEGSLEIVLYQKEDFIRSFDNPEYVAQRKAEYQDWRSAPNGSRPDNEQA